MPSSDKLPGDTILSARLSAAHWQVVRHALRRAGPGYVVAPLLADLDRQLDGQAAGLPASIDRTQAPIR